MTPARAATSPLAVTSGSRGGDAFVRACVPEGEPNHWPTLVTDSVSVSVASNAPPHSKSLMHSCLGSDSGNLNHRPIYLLVCLFVCF